MDLFYSHVEGDLLIVLRLWRLARIAHGVIETGHAAHERKHAAQHLKEKKTEMLALESLREAEARLRKFENNGQVLRASSAAAPAPKRTPP